MASKSNFMKNLIALATVLLTISLMAAPVAEAKRLGGGTNVGKQYTMPKSSSAPQTQASAPTAKPAAMNGNPRPSGASRWLGPLAGLAAGGLLASLLFGDAFEGLQVMDFLLILGLIGGGILLFRMMRRGSNPIPAAVGPGRASNPLNPPESTSNVRPVSPLAGPSVTQTSDAGQSPSWFDANAFVAGARNHFLRMQAAWDRGDFNDIRDYATPDLYDELVRERQALGPDLQATEVVTLNVSLAGLRRDGDMLVASLEFSGLIREELNGVANPFREIWHIQHPWETQAGDWFVAGIQQMD